MRGRHQSDLIWRFQVADAHVQGIPSSMEVMRKHWLTCGASSSRANIGIGAVDLQLMARDRADRIDRILEALPRRPVSLARVLYLRYGPEEHVPSLREVLPYTARIAAMTDAAKEACKRERGVAPRPHSNDLVRWLEALCTRMSQRKLRGDDMAVLADVRHEADRLLLNAEDAYEALANRTKAA